MTTIGLLVNFVLFTGGIVLVWLGFDAHQGSMLAVGLAAMLCAK